jgi:hypothetical protein
MENTQTLHVGDSVRLLNDNGIFSYNAKILRYLGNDKRFVVVRLNNGEESVELIEDCFLL